MAAETRSSREVRPAEEICAAAEVSDPAKELLRPDAPPQTYVELLIESGHFADAVRFLAHALPKREAIWWAWFCARRASGPEAPAATRAALAATEKWIVEPNEEHRRAAMAAAEQATLGTPAGCAALAVFFSGGSLAPPNAPVNPPGESLTAKAVAGCVMLAAVAAEPEKAADKYRAYLAQALEVTRKIKLWPSSA